MYEICNLSRYIFFDKSSYELYYFYADQKKIKPQTTSVSCLFGAASGACAACIYVLFKGKINIVSFACWYILIILAMNEVTFKIHNITGIVKAFLQVYITTLLLGGSLNLLYYHTYAGVYINKVVQSFKTGRLSIFKFVGFVMISYGVISIICNTFEKNQKKMGLCIYMVKLVDEEKTILVKGIYDTGNGLKDPYNNKMIHVITNRLVGWLDDLYEAKYKLILAPYNSVGKEYGLLKCIRLKEMIIEDEYGREIKHIYNPRIAISDREKININGEDIILNRELNL